MPRLRSLSFAHPEVPAEERAGLALAMATATDGPTFLLSTCLRIELVTQASISAEGVFAGGRRREGEEAFQHLCRVAAGLESPLVGEPEVLGQFRQALARYRQSRLHDPSLVRILESAVGVARSTRRLLADEPRGSLAAVAAQVAKPYARIAILGSGAMARATAAYLEGKDVSVYARTARWIGDRQTLPWTEVDSALRGFPAVISTYPGKFPMSPGFTSALVERHTPLLLIDLGMPPAFGPLNDAVHYLGIDELARRADGYASPEAEKALAADARKSWQRLRTPSRTTEVIAAMAAFAEDAADDEVARFAQRLSAAEEPELVLRQLARKVARRVMHPPISYLGSTDVDSVEVLAEAFGIDRD